MEETEGYVSKAEGQLVGWGELITELTVRGPGAHDPGAYSIRIRALRDKHELATWRLEIVRTAGSDASSRNKAHVACRELENALIAAMATEAMGPVNDPGRRRDAPTPTGGGRMNRIGYDRAWEGVPRRERARRERGLVLVFGDPKIRESVRSKLVDFGIECASALDPASLALEEGTRTLGWVRVGVDAVRPSPAEPPPWCIALDAERGTSALSFVWPDEALPFVCTVLALGDRDCERSASDIAVEQRVWFAVHRAFPPSGTLCLDVHDGVVTVAGLEGSPFIQARACALAREVLGVRAVEVLDVLDAIQ